MISGPGLPLILTVALIMVPRLVFKLSKFRAGHSALNALYLQVCHPGMEVTEASHKTVAAHFPQIDAKPIKAPTRPVSTVSNVPTIFAHHSIISSRSRFSARIARRSSVIASGVRICQCP